MKLSNAILNNKFAVGAIVLTLIYFFVVKPMLSKKESSLLAQTIKNRKINTSLLTLTDLEAEEISNSLFLEMDGINWKADHNFWMDILDRVKTKEDAALVMQFFGIRKGATLPEWLNDETSLNWLTYREIILKRFAI